MCYLEILFYVKHVYKLPDAALNFCDQLGAKVDWFNGTLWCCVITWALESIDFQSVHISRYVLVNHD